VVLIVGALLDSLTATLPLPAGARVIGSALYSRGGVGAPAYGPQDTGGIIQTGGLPVGAPRLAEARIGAVGLGNIRVVEGRAEEIPANLKALDALVACLSFMYVIDRETAMFPTVAVSSALRSRSPMSSSSAVGGFKTPRDRKTSMAPAAFPRSQDFRNPAMAAGSSSRHARHQPASVKEPTQQGGNPGRRPSRDLLTGGLRTNR